MSETAATDPLGIEAPYIRLEETGPRGQITLRGTLSGKPVANAVSAATGLAVPGALKVTHEGEMRAVWMSPDELLLMVPDGERADALAKAGKALARAHAMALDVSDARAVIRLTGPAVAEVLAKGAPCDLSDRACPLGTARRTHLAGLAVAFWRLEAEVWEIVCFRSYAHHLRAWLEASSVEGSQVG